MIINRDIIFINKLMKYLNYMSQEMMYIIEDFQNEENPSEEENFHTLKLLLIRINWMIFQKKTEMIYIHGVEFRS